MTLRHARALLVALLLSASGPVGRLDAAAKPPGLLQLDGDITRVHDPVIIREGDWYYVFATGGSIRRSKDLRHWTACGRVFERLPD